MTYLYFISESLIVLFCYTVFVCFILKLYDRYDCRLQSVCRICKYYQKPYCTYAFPQSLTWNPETGENEKGYLNDEQYFHAKKDGLPLAKMMNNGRCHYYCFNDTTISDTETPILYYSEKIS